MTGPRNADGTRGKMGRRLYAHVSPVCARIGQLKAVICAKHHSEENHALIVFLCIKDLICCAFRHRFRFIAMTCWRTLPDSIFPTNGSRCVLRTARKGPSPQISMYPQKGRPRRVSGIPSTLKPATFQGSFANFQKPSTLHSRSPLVLPPPGSSRARMEFLGASRARAGRAVHQFSGQREPFCWLEFPILHNRRHSKLWGGGGNDLLQNLLACLSKLSMED